MFFEDIDPPEANVSHSLWLVLTISLRGDVFSPKQSQIMRMGLLRKVRSQHLHRTQVQV
jgi:hypothetical protein